MVTTIYIYTINIHLGYVIYTCVSFRFYSEQNFIYVRPIPNRTYTQTHKNLLFYYLNKKKI